MEEELLIPESVAIACFNRATGANCETLEEAVQYLEDHPEARELIRLAAGGTSVQ
jgi:hypothetical protein